MMPTTCLRSASPPSAQLSPSPAYPPQACLPLHTMPACLPFAAAPQHPFLPRARRPPAWGLRTADCPSCGRRRGGAACVCLHIMSTGHVTDGLGTTWVCRVQLQQRQPPCGRLHHTELLPLGHHPWPVLRPLPHYFTAVLTIAGPVPFDKQDPWHLRWQHML